jgi:hypothetical protein
MNGSTQPNGMHFGLWVAQFLIGVPFVFFGGMKIVCPINVLSATMPWTGEVNETMVRLFGLIDVAGGLGLLLPGLTGIKPGLTKVAAIGCIILQVAAGAFHVIRGEAAMAPLNLIFLLLAIFILWGRTTRAPLRS